MPDARRQIEIGGLRIAYRVEAERQPDVFLHGFDQFNSEVRSFLRSVAD